MFSKKRPMTMDNKTKAALIFDRLHARFPLPETMLAWKNPWELLVATMLAAQCTDTRVNLVTPKFFRRWPGPQELSRARIPEVDKNLP
jgi:endonuclease-3